MPDTANKPLLVELEAGREYRWCACGRSAKQPFCDGSHRGSGIEPLRFEAPGSGEVLLCVCKKTRSPPWCDGSHNELAEEYALASTAEIAASAGIVPTARDPRTGKAQLDGGCYVLGIDETALQPHGTLRIAPVIDAHRGARYLSQWYALLDPGSSPVLRFAGSDVVLFVADAALRIEIGERVFAAGADSGVFVRADEAFRLHNNSADAQRVLLTVCPQCPQPQWLEQMPPAFDTTLAQRVFGVDPALQQAMADRFYQVLNGIDNGCREITQFIGEIPCSRAAAHRHLYEEALLVLAGEGILWTPNACAAVQQGDVIFLPRKQLHSLECTSPGGMRLVGAFYPSGSPAINF